MNSGFDALTAQMVKTSLKNKSHTDFIGEDGLLHCSVCGEPKQTILSCVPGFLNGQKVGIMCACGRKKEEERIAAIEKNRIEMTIEELRRDGITDDKYNSYTFENDKGFNPSVMEYCRYFVDSWEERQKSGKGILFYGSQGAGKSFAAGCIVNAVIEKYRSPAFVTNFPRLLNMNFEARENAVQKIAASPLVVFDDLGAERGTEAALETVFYTIDTRALSGKPTIFTTNLELKTLETEQRTDLKRIYDRVLGMCPVRLCMTGESHRRGNADEAQGEERESFIRWKKERNQE